MNWNKIKTDNPKVWDKLISWLNCTVDVLIEDNKLVTYTPSSPVHSYLKDRQTMNTRRLYDFFDENNIYIFMVHNPFSSSMTTCCYEIYSGVVKVHENKSVALTRIKSETEAFTKAFEILEKEL